MNKKDLEIREQTRKEIYDLIVGLYQEETNAYNNYMASNPGDKERTKDHILTNSIYCKILHAIRRDQRGSNIQKI